MFLTIIVNNGHQEDNSRPVTNKNDDEIVSYNTNSRNNGQPLFLDYINVLDPSHLTVRYPLVASWNDVLDR